MDLGGGQHGNLGQRPDMSPNLAQQNMMPGLPFGFGFAGGSVVSGPGPAGLLSPMHGGPMYGGPVPPQQMSSSQLFLSGGHPLSSPMPPSLSPPRQVVPPQPLPVGSSYSPLQSPGLGPYGGQGPGSVNPGMNGSASKLGGGRHLCAICEDAASGKHYGVYSCEGCKGFFKRTVRKDLRYTCREDNHCIVDKRQRNRCQACRYQRCLQTGMKREAVQEERLSAAEKAEMEAESTTAGKEMPIDNIMYAETKADMRLESGLRTVDIGFDGTLSTIGLQTITDQLSGSVVEWAVNVPHFLELSHDDQLMLLKAGWNELLIAAFAHRSVSLTDCIAFSSTVRISRGAMADQVGLGLIFDRILTDLVAKMRAMIMDQVELGCLRVIVLYNPDAKGLQSVQQVESMREKVYVTLEEYCRQQYPDEPGRFAKLLLRLPALRSIGLKCPNFLFLNTPGRVDSPDVETYISMLLNSIYSG